MLYRMHVHTTVNMQADRLILVDIVKVMMMPYLVSETGEELTDMELIAMLNSKMCMRRKMERCPVCRH